MSKYISDNFRTEKTGLRRKVNGNTDLAIKREHHKHLQIMKKKNREEKPKESLTPKGLFQTEKNVFTAFY